jgi:hypothetical protein
LLSIKNIAFTRILLDQDVYVAINGVCGRLPPPIWRARPDHEWVGTLVFGSALVWLEVTLVADGLEGGAGLDALSGMLMRRQSELLIEGTLLIYNGSQRSL